ncbi:MAG: hypothetical protein ACYC6I_12045 [Bacillota bacterium]
MKADAVFLDGSVLTVDARNSGSQPGNRVLLTMVGGEVVHERSGFIEGHQERQAH